MTFRFSKVLMVHPKSPSGGNLQFPASLDFVSGSCWISGDIVTCLIPYSSKQCCRYPSVFSHCLREVVTGTQTWRDPKITLKIRRGMRWNTTTKGDATYDWDKCQTWRSCIESTSGICRVRFRQVEEIARKRNLTERRSSFTFVRSRCVGEASRRILPVLRAAIECKISSGYVFFSMRDGWRTYRNGTTKNNETDQEWYSGVCIKAFRRIKLHQYKSGQNNRNI